MNDGLYQVKTLKRGTLTGNPPTGISGTPAWEENWNYDPSGNWRGTSTAYLTKDSGTTRHYYYSDQWQVLEERLGTNSYPERRFVWGQRHIDDLVLRDRDADADGSHTLEERLYVCHDAMHVAAIVDTSGTVLERYGYTWETLFDACRHDAHTGLCHVRYRFLHPQLGRWINRDPIEERGGINLFGFAGNAPPNDIDAFGLATDDKRAEKQTKDLREALEKLRELAEDGQSCNTLLDEIKDAIKNGRLNRAKAPDVLSGILGISGIPGGTVDALEAFAESPDCRKMVKCGCVDKNFTECAKNAEGCSQDLGLAFAKSPGSSLGSAIQLHLEDYLTKSFCQPRQPEPEKKAN